MIDPLFGKYCYIDTPWIAGKHTIYRIIRSGVRSNSWCEVPVNGRTEKVNHGEHSEEIVFVMLDTLIDEDTKIMRFALKDVEIIEMADRKTESDSEKPNNCEMPCEECGHWEHGAGNHYYCALLEMGQECYFESKNESTLMFANEPKTEPQTCANGCKWLDQDGECTEPHGECHIEYRTEVDEPQAERSEQ